ncbi:MAG: hypothetical protein FWF57_04255 [Defluviitaleaceae bacterium]|nr:hypothetical protein [Defluviitaleaceae bacterium]
MEEKNEKPKRTNECKTEVSITGTITTSLNAFISSDREIYKFIITVPRLSGNLDYIPISIPKDIALKEFKEEDLKLGAIVQIKGEIRTYTLKTSELKLSVFVHDIKPLIFKSEEKTTITTSNETNSNNKNNPNAPFENFVYLRGFVCQKSNKPNSTKDVTNMMVVVNKNPDYLPEVSYYIPVVGFDVSSKIEVGNYVEIIGRLQSRSYFKDVERTIHEIATGYINILS